MIDKLLPCPFCGGEARKSGETFERTILQWVYCTSCGAAGGYRHTEAEAIAAWNTRAERTCEMEYIADFMSWHCKACDMMDMAPRNPKPKYCKWCGAKVVS